MWKCRIFVCKFAGVFLAADALVIDPGAIPNTHFLPARLMPGKLEASIIAHIEAETTSHHHQQLHSKWLTEGRLTD
eukprot:6132113-Amphidinium_carterae.2